MASKVSISSMALLKLGANPIASFDEDSFAARLCSNIWNSVRDSVLRSHPWNCAIKRVSLAPTTTAPVYGYSYAFTLPADCLRLLEVEDGDDHKIESREILADTNPLNIKYIFRNENENSYDALFIDALVCAMTAELAYPITKSTSQQEIAWEIYTEKLRLARTVDAQEDSPDTMGDFPLLNVRTWPPW